MFKQYRKIERGEFFVVGYDLSMGGRDKSAAQFLSKTKLDVPLVYHTSKIATEATNEIVPVLERLHDATGIRPLIAPERNAGGAFEAERIAAMNRTNKYDVFKMPAIGQEYPPDAVKFGWDTNTATRPAMLTSLKDAIDKRVLKIYDKRTIEELYAFVVMQTSSAWKAQAEKGAFDDLVISLAIAWQLQGMVVAPSEGSYAQYKHRLEGVADEDIGI